MMNMGDIYLFIYLFIAIHVCLQNKIHFEHTNKTYFVHLHRMRATYVHEDKGKNILLKHNYVNEHTKALLHKHKA